MKMEDFSKVVSILLERMGCTLIHHSSRYDWYQNPKTRISQPVPRHREIKEYLAKHVINIKITGYLTEKNPDLLRRIMQVSSNSGDLVLDCSAGSGTTLAVADEIQRH